MDELQLRASELIMKNYKLFIDINEEEVVLETLCKCLMKENKWKIQDF